ncbi:MAG: alpha/beta hydrolase [Candidatus Pacearchaeota archaeon]|nr:alpha/beta hydrolase [Candidatus Pacearchaeota archaeon]
MGEVLVKIVYCVFFMYFVIVIENIFLENVKRSGVLISLVLFLLIISIGVIFGMQLNISEGKQMPFGISIIFFVFWIWTLGSSQLSFIRAPKVLKEAVRESLKNGPKQLPLPKGFREEMLDIQNFGKIQRISIGDFSRGDALFIVPGNALQAVHYESLLREYYKMTGKAAFTISLPGTGKSEGSVDQTTEKFVDILAEVIKVSCKDEIILLGHSYGGELANHLANREEIKINLLVLLSANSIDKTDQFMYRLLKKLFLELRIIRKHFASVSMMMEWGNDTEELVKVAGSLKFEYPSSAMLDGFTESLPENIPVIFISGNRERIIPQKSLGGVRKIQVNGGHLVITEAHAKEVINHIVLSLFG